MKLKQYLNIKGIISVEALITVPIIIILFSTFIFYISYIKTVLQLTEDLNKKAYEFAVNDYKYHSSLPRIVKLYNEQTKRKMNIEYLFCYTNTLGDHITIYVDCIYNGYIKKSKIHLQQQIKKWKGDGINFSEINVWELSNYKRGIKIEEVFGGNLPRYFPTIDGYNQLTGEILLITSINSTSQSYKTYKNLYKRIIDEVEKLKTFKGTQFETYKISSEDISSRKLIVIFPTNSFSRVQLNVLEDIKRLCENKDIIFLVKRYQNAIIK